MPALLFPGLDVPAVLDGRWFSGLSPCQRAALADRCRDRFQSELSACLAARLSSGQRRALNVMAGPGRAQDRAAGPEVAGFLRHAIPDLDEVLARIREGIVIDLLSAAGDLARTGSSTKEGEHHD